MPTRRQLRGALVASLALGALALLASGAVVREQVDLEVYWTAASRAAAAEPLYRASDGHYQFKYLPAFAVLATPLGAVEWPAAKIVWFVVSAMLLAWLVTLSLGTLAVRRKPTWLLVAATVLVMGKFYGHELVLGQVNVLFAVAVVGAILLLRGRHEAAAGACIALAIVIKPYAVLFLPWLLARQRAASILAALSGLVIALLLPVPLYGVAGTLDLHVEWWRTVTASTEPNLTNNDNVSIAAMYAKWLGIGGVATSLAAATGLVLLAVLARVFRRRSGLAFPEGLEGALLLTAIPLLSPQGWDYVFLISTPAAMHLVNHEDALPPWLRALALVSLAVIGLSLFDVMGRAAYSAFMALSIITLCYGVVIAALAVLRSRGTA
jgi:hypothetical protein